MSNRLTQVLRDSVGRGQIISRTKKYIGLHDESDTGNVEVRKKGYTELVNTYYDLVTDFYEYGWGESFHFAPRVRGESFHASLARHEMYLAHRLGLRPSMKVVDVGCGVGGPMRTIARFSGANVVGVNNNDYQIKRGTLLNHNAGLSNLCSFMKSDFMNMRAEDASFDAAYAVEATCHAPDKVGIYSEILRVLKPGSLFAAYEWCLTDLYDANNEEHRRIKKGIETGDALPDIAYTHEVDAALEQAGFELLESRDVAGESDREVPWYLPLEGKSLSLTSFRSSAVGRWITHQSLGVLERVKLAPDGSQSVHEMLNNAADALIAGGRTGIFTPMYFVLARKRESN